MSVNFIEEILTEPDGTFKIPFSNKMNYNYINWNLQLAKFAILFPFPYWIANYFDLEREKIKAFLDKKRTRNTVGTIHIQMIVFNAQKATVEKLSRMLLTFLVKEASRTFVKKWKKLTF